MICITSLCDLQHEINYIVTCEVADHLPAERLPFVRGWRLINHVIYVVPLHKYNYLRKDVAVIINIDYYRLER